MWGGTMKKWWGTVKKIFPALRAGNCAPPLSNCFRRHCVRMSSSMQRGVHDTRCSKSKLVAAPKSQKTLRPKRICRRLCRKHLDMSRWFVSAAFMICVHDFPCGEVSVKVGVMEFGLLSQNWPTKISPKRVIFPCCRPKYYKKRF